MARNLLPLDRYEARKVLLPERPGETRLIEAVRVTVYGPSFPQRAIEPELLVGDSHAERVAIARDQRSITGFFAKPPPDGAPIRVRYGDSLEGALETRFSHQSIAPLPKSCEA